MALIVGLTGVDGAGKSAAARAAAGRLRVGGERVRYHHELEMVMFRPLYRALTRPFGRGRGDAMRDRFVAASARPGLAADVYFLLLWLDSMLAYAWFRVQPGIVLHDRWLYDQLALMDRIGYGRRAVRWLYERFPRPDRLVLLAVSPATALARKAADPGHRGDTLAFFEAGAERIAAAATRRGVDTVIDAEQPLDAVVSRLVGHVQAWRERAAAPGGGTR